MSRTAVRAGAAVSPLVTTAGTPGSADRVLTFSSTVRPCIVTNNTGVVVYVKVNSIDASATDYHFAIASGASQEVSLGGMVDIRSVSLYLASDIYSSVVVAGWPA